jgi:UDP-N-acetylmuramoyl-tripeptide--D-alanyl-D-alanine ligase
LKKVLLNIEDIFNVQGAIIYEPDKFKSIGSVSIDSRRIKKNTMFVAIKGERFDGHDFVLSAVKKGASAVVIDKQKLNLFDDVKVAIVTVNDTTLALGDIAQIWRKKINATVIGITGSSGKTTVKNMLAEILSEKFKVNKTEANNNNQIGVPLTILNTNETHEILVAELGTNHYGEIPYSANILSPDFSLITNIGESHLEYLKTKNGVWKEKSFLFEETIKNDGKVFLNYDDPIIKAKYSKRGKNVSFGFTGKVDVGGTVKSYTDDGKPVIEINYKKRKAEITLPVYGEQNAKNFLACCAVALELGLNLSEIKSAVKKLKSHSGRLDVQHYKNFILIDDTYNANPDSTKAAIELVGRIKTHNRKILFLGDMLELGKSSIRLHRGLQNIIKKSGIDEVYTIGSKMKSVHKILDNKKIIAKHFSKRKALLNQIRKMDFDYSVVLVKGSRGLKMEEFVSEIIKKTMN